MPSHDLLPGVTTATCPPPVICDAHREIRKARRRAFARDAVQIGLLVAVDYLFVRWPDSRMPFLERGDSLTMLRVINLVLVAHLSLSRVLPRWMARRVASTWSRSERDRFERDEVRAGR